MNMPVKNLPQKNKLIIIVGPTSSGKSELAVKLAKKLNGEIISADSRQIYKGMDLGTGKIPGQWIRGFYIYKKTPHHLIDFVSPCRQFSVAKFKALAQKKIKDILARGKTPILCGGTAHWIDAVVFDQNIPDVKPNKKLRANLEKKSADALYNRLYKLDPARAFNIDHFNKRRLIRALEIVISSGKPVPPFPLLPKIGESKVEVNAIWIGINLPQETLFTKIKTRLGQRIRQGMINEVKKLHRDGLSWRRLESFGLEYKFVSLYLQKKLAYEEMIRQLSLAIKHYSKRQMTWWKKNKKIRWFNLSKHSHILKNVRMG
jgi:tRNA dimethylallyltransferase